jgi:deoxyribodipyrimidine photolyase
MGWCHNRVRVVASHFLVKHLLLPWQWGLKHLWDCQIDADLECDALGWQYVSGCLSDAHPFHYLLDLDKEWQRFDPDGHYVRRWLPVLSQLPAQYIHQPWAAPPEVLEAAGRPGRAAHSKR